MKKVIITANNVSAVDKNAKHMLEQAGFYVEEYPNAALYSQEELISLLKDADAVIAGTEQYTEDLLTQLPKLKLIARRGVGVDNIDMTAAMKNGIEITRTEGLVGSAVAELIMTYILENARMLSIHCNDMKQSIWSRRLSEGVSGKHLGLVGFGSIAKETALRANAFGMKVFCYHQHRDISTEKKHQTTYLDFETLISTSDYLSINVPLTKETENMFTMETFEKMKPSCVLINTARSRIVKTSDLVQALNENKIRNAYIDVFDQEPYTDSPLNTCENAFLTPHIGTFTRSTFTAMNNRCAEQIIEFFSSSEALPNKQH